jgi:hypothetical protein
VAVELKLGKFRASYKGQMELYLRWLERNEMQKGEKTPIALYFAQKAIMSKSSYCNWIKQGLKWLST